MQDVDGKVSFGLTDLDRLMKGGMEKGSMTLIELGHSIPTAISGMLERSLVANFTSYEPRRLLAAHAQDLS